MKSLIPLTLLISLNACGSKSLPESGVLPGESTPQSGTNKCDSTMLKRLRSLKTSNTVVVIAANVGATIGSTSRGINYFYDEEIDSLSCAALALRVPRCSIVPDELSIPNPEEGMSPGRDINEVVSECRAGRP